MNTERAVPRLHWEDRGGLHIAHLPDGRIVSLSAAGNALYNIDIDGKHVRMVRTVKAAKAWVLQLIDGSGSASDA